MISEIEQAIVDHIKTRMAAAASRIAVQRGVDDIRQPGVYASIEAGKFTRVTNTTYRHELTVWVDMIFSNLASESERRKGVAAILEAVLGYLFMQDLGLKIEPLQPKNWKNTTVEEMSERGLMAFSLELSTSYPITIAEEAQTDDLLFIGLNYYLTPGDDQVDASDLITLANN